MSFDFQKMNSPAGTLYLVAKDERLHAVLFDAQWAKLQTRFAGLTERATPVLRDARWQLAEYFAGRRRIFDLPLALDGTDFQKRVWQALGGIPFGQTRTYAQQAAAAQAPRAVRAVGRTNGLNRLCIVLPCHRVVGADGALTGYAGGLKAKKALLDLEAAALL